MFASQLLRILQSIPSDVKHETCVFDQAEQDTKMKENQNMVLYGAETFRKETNPFVMENEDIHQLKSSTTDTGSLAFEVKPGDGHWNPFVDDDFSVDIAKGNNRFSVVKDNSNGLAYALDIEEDEDKVSFESGSKEEKQGHECPITADEHHEFRRSSLPSIADPDEPDTKMYTDKNVLECELPEFPVCYKEINYHIVKDICVDEGLPVVDKNSLGSYKQQKEADRYALQPREDNRCEDARGNDMEFFIQEELAMPPFGNKVKVNEDESGIDEERFDTQGKPKPQLESCLHKDAAKHGDPEDSQRQAGEANRSKSGDTMTDAPKVESFIDKKLPIQEFGTRSFLRSFMSSLDFEENQVGRLPNQVTSGKAASGGFVASPADESKEDIQTTSLIYNSEMENGIITFNFNASAPTAAERIEDIVEQTVGSVNLHDHASTCRSDNAKQIDLASSKDDGIEKSHVQSVKSHNEKSDDSSTTLVQSVSNDRQNLEKVPVDKVGNSDEVAIGDPIPHKIEGQTVEAIKHEGPNFVSVPVVNRLQPDEGEASFSAAAAGLITYSGPVTYSGSVSLRSDGSATSGRSFAFPVLQDEWNSSPVRMAKADRRGFRKHKGWRSGLLCCKF